MTITGPGGTHRMFLEKRLGLYTRRGGHVIADDLQCVEDGSVCGDDCFEVLTTAEGVRGNNRRGVAPDRLQEVGQGNPAWSLVKVGEAIDQEVTL